MSDGQGILEEHELESFRESGVYEVFPLLRRGLLHRTSIKGYWGIKESGFILPNRGQFSYSYPQSKSYYGPTRGYVCLFDFESASEEECILVHDTWGGFFSDHKPATIVLRLNRERLGNNLILNSAAPKLEHEEYKGYIPFVEAWYPKPVPIAAIDGYIITFWDSKAFKTRFEEYPVERVHEFENIIKMLEELWLKAQESRK
jgi:hypothetical protein